MSARFARSAFQAARRAAVAPNAARAGRRTMSSSADQFATQHSDQKWIIGSALVFGPALAYLLSPSGREAQKHKAAHGDANEQVIKTHERHPAQKEEVIMEDSEGTPANVAASISLAEEANVPKNDVSEEKFAETKQAADAEGQETAAPAAETVSSATIPEEVSSNVEKSGEEGPVDQQVARETAVENTPPKAQKEESDGDKN